MCVRVLNFLSLLDIFFDMFFLFFVRLYEKEKLFFIFKIYFIMVCLFIEWILIFEFWNL